MLDNWRVNIPNFKLKNNIIEKTLEQKRKIKTQHWGQHQIESMAVTYPETWVASK